MSVWPPVDVCSCLGAVRDVRAYCGVNRDIDIAVAAKGIGFADKAAVLDSDAVLTLGIQFAGQQLGFQCLDDLRESPVEHSYLRLTPFTYQTGPIG